MRMFITKNTYLSNDMKIFATCSIPLSLLLVLLALMSQVQNLIYVALNIHSYILFSC